MRARVGSSRNGTVVVVKWLLEGTSWDWVVGPLVGWFMGWSSARLMDLFDAMIDDEDGAEPAMSATNGWWLPRLGTIPDMLRIHELSSEGGSDDPKSDESVESWLCSLAGVDGCDTVTTLAVVLVSPASVITVLAEDWLLRRRTKEDVEEDEGGFCGGSWSESMADDPIGLVRSDLLVVRR